MASAGIIAFRPSKRRGMNLPCPCGPHLMPFPDPMPVQPGCWLPTCGSSLLLFLRPGSLSSSHPSCCQHDGHLMSVLLDVSFTAWNLQTGTFLTNRRLFLLHVAATLSQADYFLNTMNTWIKPFCFCLLVDWLCHLTAFWSSSFLMRRHWLIL